MIACAVHGVLSGPAIERIEKSPIDKLIVTNTIPLNGGGAACKRSSCCRWRGCSGRRSRAFTKRRRSRRCSCNLAGIPSNHGDHGDLGDSRRKILPPCVSVISVSSVFQIRT